MKEIKTYNPTPEEIKSLEENSSNSNLSDFVQNHKKGIAVGTALAAVITEGSTVFASTTTSENRAELNSAYISVNPELDINVRYANALSPLVAMATTANVEKTASVEVNKNNSKNKIIFRVNKPYYLLTSSEGTNLIRKTDTSPEMVQGQAMLPLEMIGNILGAKSVFDKKSQTTTVTREGKIAKIKNGSKLMTVTEKGKNRTVTLDLAPRLNKNGKVEVSFKAINETFGSKVLFDRETQSVLINYTDAERKALFGSDQIIEENMPGDMIDLDATYKAFQYMINGSKTNCLTINTYVFVDKISGAKVVLSSDDMEAADEKISQEKKDIMTIEELQQAYLEQSPIGQVRKNLKKDDFVYVNNGSSYVFSGDKVRILSGTKNNIVEIAGVIPSKYAGCKIKWSEKDGSKGTFLVDKNEKIVSAYNAENNYANGGTKEIVQSEAIALAAKFVAGGEFLDKNNFPYAVGIGSNGEINVYSSNTINTNEKTVFDSIKGEWGKVRFCLDGKRVVVFDAVKSKLGKDSVVKCFGPNNETRDIKFNRNRQFYFSDLVWDKKYGVCVSDGIRLTDSYNYSTNGFEEISGCVEVGTPDQLIKKKVQRIFNNTLQGQTNSMGLDKAEVDKFLKTGSDEGFKTFKIIKAADGTPKSVMVTSADCGIKPLDVKFFMDSLDYMNNIDPDYIKNWCVDFITLDAYKGQDFYHDPAHFNYVCSFWVYDFGNYLTYKPQVSQADKDYLDTHPDVYNSCIYGQMARFYLESRGVKDYTRLERAGGNIDGKGTIDMKDKLDDGVGFDKAKFVLQKASEFNKKIGGKITQELIDSFVYEGNAEIEAYKNREASNPNK